MQLKCTTLLSVLVLLLLPGIPGCKKSSAVPLPASGAVPGWNKTSETRTFAAKDLWQYIDGDAEQYVAAGVISASTAEYSYNNQIEAVVDVYTMKDASGAHSILVKGKSNDSKPAPVGDEAVQFAQSLSFRKGSVLVRMVAYRSGPATEQALLSLGQAVAHEL